MVFLRIEKQTANIGAVVLIHYAPELLGAEDLKEGILVESVPEAELKAGKQPVLYINTQTKEMWYEYEDIPLPAEERIAQLERENAELKKSNLDTQVAILEVYEMIMDLQAK